MAHRPTFPTHVPWIFLWFFSTHLPICFLVPGNCQLNPRKPFKSWGESIAGSCMIWVPVPILSIAVTSDKSLPLWVLISLSREWVRFYLSWAMSEFSRVKLLVIFIGTLPWNLCFISNVRGLRSPISRIEILSYIWEGHNCLLLPDIFIYKSYAESSLYISLNSQEDDQMGWGKINLGYIQK